MSTHAPLSLAPVAALLLAILPGCSVDQQKEVATYRQVLDADAPRQHAALSADQPLTLQLALALANQDNEQLSIAGETYLQALIAKTRVIADFLPTVSFAPRFFARDPVDEDDSHFNRNFDAPIEAGYGSFNSLRSLADFKTAAAAIEQRKALLLDLKAALLIDVARAFYEVLRLERQVTVLENSLAVQEERVRDVEAQLAAGTGRPLDLAQARAQAAGTRVLVVEARGNVKNARTALALLIGAPKIDGPLLDHFEVPADPQPPEHFRQQALDRRQDLAAARAAVFAARHAVDAAIAQYYPSVSLNLDYFVYRESDPSDSLFTALIQAHIPLFTADRIHADVRSAWSVFRQTKLAQSLTQRRVLQDVEIAYQDLVISENRLRELEVQVQAAQEAFNQAADLVRVGRATNLERLIAQDQLLNAQLQYSSEVFNHKVSYLNVQRVAGLLSLDVQLPEAPTPVQHD